MTSLVFIHSLNEKQLIDTCKDGLKRLDVFLRRLRHLTPYRIVNGLKENDAPSCRYAVARIHLRNGG